MSFAFCFSKTENNNYDLDSEIKLDDYTFFYESNTPVSYCESGNRAVILYGLCVNVFNGNHKNPAKEILDYSDDWQTVISYEKSLGGKYIIICKENGRYFVLPDATASIPVFYNNQGPDFECSSNCMYLADKFGFQRDKKLMKIRTAGDISQAMPYDITEYSEIRQLLPNHYLDIYSGKAVRFINEDKEPLLLSAEQAAKQTSQLILNLFHFYSSEMKCMCPITGGRDSRVVLAVFHKALADKTEAYTIKHANQSDFSADLAIPKKISEICDISYSVFHDLPVDKETIEKFNHLLGENRYSSRTLMIAHTILSNTKGKAVINGDIIGQVGKCSLHRDIPYFLATPGYFRCKLHNYSKEAKKFLRIWLKEIKESGEKVNTFDLFSIESRMGRWAGQENLIYNISGQPYFNIFNSRSIIYKWTCVPRKERKNSLLHIELLKIIDMDLLKIDFESDSSLLVKIAKSNGILYYLFSFMKFYAEKIMFVLRKGN